MSLYRFDAFELDADLYRLSRAGELVAIGPKPFDLLFYLIKNGQRTISKPELIREIWHAEVVSDSSIPTCITAVRRALGDDPEKPKFIETVRGRGYRFIANATPISNDQIDSNPRPGGISASKLFVGRQAEIAALTTSLSQAFNDDLQMFLLLGEAGIGKTRMIEEFAHLAAAQGASVLFGRCREEEGAPAFWPWMQILRTHIESANEKTLIALEPYAAVLSQMLPELRKLFPEIAPVPDVEAKQARFRLLDAITSFLHASAKQKPLVMAIDDLHRADISSLLLLEFLVRELRNTPIFILGAYRDLDMLGDMTREQSLARAMRSASSRAIQLKGISRNAVSELVSQPADSELVSVLYEQSAGNPFFLTQLVQILEIESVEPSNRLPDGWRFLLPAGVKDAISSQLNGLSSRSNQTLIVAAVIGRTFMPSLLARALGVDLPQVIERLEPAITARLIEGPDHPSGSYRFCHALLRDVVYDQISRLDRGRLHKQIGEALEALYPSDLDSCIAELSFHFSESATVGDAGKAVAYCIAAGEQAAARLAHENASAHFRNAIQLMELWDIADPRKRCELLIQLGAAEMRAGERQAARNSLLHAANIARKIDAPELLARAALGLAPGFFTIEVGAYDPELESLLNEARLAIPKVQSDLLVQLTARLAMAAVWSNTTASCESLSATAINLARNVSNPITKAYALRARHGALWGPECFEERCHLIAELGKITDTSGDAEIALIYRILNITALLEIGNILDADREIRAYTDLARTLQLPHAEWYVGLFSAMRDLMEGRYSAAALSAQKFLEIGNRVHDQNATQSFAAHLVLRFWEDNRLTEIASLVEESITKHPTISAWKCVASFLYSEIKNPEGTRLFEEFSEFGFSNLPRNETWSIAIQMLSNTCVNMNCVVSAQQLYELLVPGKMHHTIVGYGVMSWGSRARELGNLASLMGRFEEAAEHFELAISQNRKTGAAPWVARSQYDYAQMLARQRDPNYRKQIRGLVTEARRTANRLGMVRLKLQIAELMKEL